jgi:RND superfamily putative drug exporter
VIVDTQDFSGDLKPTLEALSVVGSVSEPVKGQINESIVAYDIELKLNPYSNEAMDVTVIISYFSALGLGWVVIHYLFGADAIQGLIPLYTFIFLGALGVDYNLFMKSSIWKKARTMPLNDAIKEGASETGAVISSAGIILAGTFAVLATLPIQVLVHFGIITAIGVLIDTFLVRLFLVPAINAWLGEKSFWPGKMR